MDRIERINHMESIFERAEENVKALKENLEEFEKLLPQIEELESYYSSDAYMLDIEADERGEIPKEIKRGILSEDGIWNTLNDKDACLYLMKKLSEDKI